MIEIIKNKSHTATEIFTAIQEASAWCLHHWNASEPRASLRSLQLQPNLFEENHDHKVKHVIYARKYELKNLDIDFDDQFLNRGKILIYEPDVNIADCLSEAETNGYFDAYDCPLWDTWIGYITLYDGNSYLLSWVLNEIIPIVNAGFEVNPVECFYWLDSAKEQGAITLRKYLQINQ